MRRTVCAFLVFAATAFGQTLVAVDGFHNDESKMPGHYRWENTQPGGFSEFGKVLRGLGAELRTVKERITPAALAGIGVFIIVDPDTPAETDDPKYLEPAEIAALEQWVKQGGRLVLLGNDKGNAEFEHFNQLAARFGIQFIEDTYPKVTGKGILTVTGQHPIFENGLSLYLVEIAPLKISGNAEIVLADKGTPLMALARAGKGQVFALGDPWVYNEYIDRKDNRRIATNLFRMLLKNDAGETWKFDNLDRIGGHPATVVGHPRVIDTPEGKAVEFDGVGDALFVDVHPLAGAETFTWEIVFRPDPGGAPEQRFFHLQEKDPKTGQDTATRMLSEIRIVNGQWCLDSFALSGGASKALLDRTRLHSLGAWHHVAMVYDGRELRNYVDGVLEGKGEVKLTPQGEGHSSIGVRINRRDYFKGAVRVARMTPRALSPAEFLH